MKNFLVLLFLLFFASAGWSQIHNDGWIHSYIKLKTHWDPSQTSVEVRTCIRQETTPVITAPGEGYYPLYQSIDPSTITYTFLVDGSPVTFNGSSGTISGFTPGSTINISLLAQVPGFPDYQFDADILVDLINPTITYNTIPASSVFNLPASLLRTTKGDTGGCDGELKLNISGGYPYSGANPYAINYDNPTNYYLDTLANLCANTTVAYKWGDDWWGCKGNFCDPNVSSNCTPTTGFCSNDGFFCDDVTIETRNCSLNDFFGGAICEGMMVDFELVSVPGSNSYSYSFGGAGNFQDIMNPSDVTSTTAYPFQNYTATVNHLDGSVFTCTSPLMVEVGNPYLNLLSDSLNVCLGDTIIFEAGADWFYGQTIDYNYSLYGNQYNSSSDSIIISTDTIGVFDLTFNHATSDLGCISTGGMSISFEVIDCDTLENPIAGFECLETNVICMDSCISFENTSSYGNNPSFTWDFGNGQTSSLEDHANPICYNEEGYYTVSLTVEDENGTDTHSYAIQVIDCSPANLDEFGKSELDFNLYPNPTESEFTVSLKSENTESVNIFIYDVLGNKIDSNSLSTKDKNKTFNLDNYSDGIYYVELRSSSNSVIKKIVLSK
jgi:PKD repeat protein